MFNPNTSQKNAITHPPAPLMILAGAGTGKTSTLVHRIINLIENNLTNPQSILVITYTEKAAGELKKRIIDSVGTTAEKMTVSTFHGFCYDLIKTYGTSSSIPRLIEESESSFLLLSKFEELGPFKSRDYPKDPANAVTKYFLPFINRVRDELIDPLSKSGEIENLDVEKNNQLEDLKRIYPIFQKWKKELNVVDYGDMIAAAFDLLNNNPNLLGKVQSQFKHLVIDEFQDNNFALNKIIGLIGKKYQQITVVGDEDQVIYSFRGASIHNINLFRDTYSNHPQYLEITLEENFRSNQEILDLANASIKNNKDRVEKSLTAAKGKATYLPILVVGEKQNQNFYIAQEIKQLTYNDNQYNDIAVLCRTRSQASEIASFLIQSGLPVQSRYPNFFDIGLIKDLNAWCQVVGGGKYQDISFYRLLIKKCIKNIVIKFFNKFERRNSESRLEWALVNYKNEALEIRNLCKTINELRKYPKPRSAEEVINSIIEKTGMLRPFNNRYAFMDQVYLKNAGKYLKKSQDFSRRNPGKNNLRNFNIFCEALMASGKELAIFPKNDKKYNNIVVNTIHGVKGSEFPVVFMPYNRSGSFPLNFKTEKIISQPPEDWLSYIKNTSLSRKEYHTEEERRLFYVGATRAQKKLYLLAPPKATSKFIKEIPEKLMETIIMDHNQINYLPYSRLRSKYEQKLQQSLLENKFNETGDILKIIERVTLLDGGKEITWGDSSWEKQLQLEIEDSLYQPSPPKALNLSASSIKSYQDCPLKYRLNKIDAIPESQSKPPLVFGNIVHRALQRFHSQAERGSEEQLINILEQEWDSSGFFYSEQEKEFKTQGEEILKRYFLLNDFKSIDVLACEEKFQFTIDDIKINGAIDRIDKSGNTTHVIDYKTSLANSSAKSSIQLAIYSMYLEGLKDKPLGGLPDKASFYFLREKDNPLKSHSFTIDELSDKREEIKTVAVGIRSKNFEPTTGRHCDWCDYKNFICPAWEK